MVYLIIEVAKVVPLNHSAITELVCADYRTGEKVIALAFAVAPNKMGDITFQGVQ
jgi:hypothetical protein